MKDMKMCWCLTNHLKHYLQQGHLYSLISSCYCKLKIEYPPSDTMILLPNHISSIMMSKMLNLMSHDHDVQNNEYHHSLTFLTIPKQMLCYTCTLEVGVPCTVILIFPYFSAQMCVRYRGGSNVTQRLLET